MATKREYLHRLGLARPGRGKFSKVAIAALKAAEDKGMVFDDTPTPAPKPKPVNRVKVINAPALPVVDRTSVATKVSFDAATVRAWARANGVHVGARGRIPPEVFAQWHSATHSATQQGTKPVESNATGTARGEVAKATPTRSKVRTEAVAYAVVPMGTDAMGKTMRSVVIATTQCAKGHHITTCDCASMLSLPYVGNGTSVPLSLTKPVA